jgi:protein phosphatase
VSTVTVPAYLAGAGTQMLQVSFGGYSSAGRKAVNEDAFAAHQPPPGVRAAKGVIACIADGASCSDNAQLASQTAVTTFIEDYLSAPDSWPVKDAAHKVLAALNAWLFHHGSQSARPHAFTQAHNGLVTTFSGAVIKSTTAHLFHAGDSRIWLYRDGSLEPLTRDHLHLQRGGGAVLTRALGIDTHLEMDYLQEPLQTGDLLLFTSDGVHSWLSHAALQKLLDDQPSLESCARQIVDAALANGSDDNLSALLLRIDQLPLAGIDEVHRALTERLIPPPLAEGQSIDGFTVERVIHSGTRSHLYLVSDAAGVRRVLKAPSTNCADDAAALESFIREQWVGRRIDHPGVMKIEPPPAHSHFLYHLCEFIDGQTLRQWIYDHPQPPLDSVRALLQEISGALRAFQRQHMVHRDLKPENIIVTRDGHIKLIDFGTVLVGGLRDCGDTLAEQQPVGSVDYSAPEYIAGQPATHLADLYSLGVIAYEMITGSQPYAISDSERLQPRKRHWHYRSARNMRKDLPLWVDLALEKAVKPNPRERHQALSEFLQDLTVPNRALLAQRESAPLIERHPLRFWQGLALLLLLAEIMTLAMLWPGR